MTALQEEAAFFKALKERLRTQQEASKEKELERMLVERTALAELRAMHLQSLASQLTHLEERERERFARLLHDDIQQLLIAVKLNLEWLEARAAGEPERDVTAETRGLVMQLLNATRTLSVQLSPAQVMATGLRAHVEWLVEWLEQNFRLVLNLKVEGEDFDADPEILALLHQILMELMLNVTKHAAVSEASVLLRRRGGWITLRVRDRGRGFVTQAVEGTPSDSRGLRNLRSRLQIFGGSLEVKSSPNKGTTVTAHAPVRPSVNLKGESGHDAPPES